MLAGAVLARASAGLADSTMRNDTSHLELIRDWFGRPLWEIQPGDADAYFGRVLRDARPFAPLFLGGRVGRAARGGGVHSSWPQPPARRETETPAGAGAVMREWACYVARKNTYWSCIRAL